MTFNLAANFKIMRALYRRNLEDARICPQYAVELNALFDCTSMAYMFGQHNAFTINERYRLYTNGGPSKFWPSIQAEIAAQMKLAKLAVPLFVDSPHYKGELWGPAFVNGDFQHTLETLKGEARVMVFNVSVFGNTGSNSQHTMGSMVQYLLLHDKSDAMRFKLAHL